jgi:hypothetical protein
MLFSEIMTAYPDNHKKIINITLGKMQRFVTLQQEEGSAVSFKSSQVVFYVKGKSLYQVNICKTT